MTEKRESGKATAPKGFETPNCDLLLRVQPQSQLCGEFLEFLQSKFILCVDPPLGHAGGYFRAAAAVSSEKLLAEFFGIDSEGLEQEKRAILESIRRK